MRATRASVTRNQLHRPRRLECEPRRPMRKPSHPRPRSGLRPFVSHGSLAASASWPNSAKLSRTPSAFAVNALFTESACDAADRTAGRARQPRRRRSPSRGLHSPARLAQRQGLVSHRQAALLASSSTHPSSLPWQHRQDPTNAVHHAGRAQGPGACHRQPDVRQLRSSAHQEGARTAYGSMPWAKHGSH